MQNDERLTDDFRLSEFVQSDTATRRGIDNTPTPEALQAIREHLAPGMQRVRDLLNELKPEHRGRVSCNVSSGYRCQALNAAVGGSKTSQHMRGESCDFTAARFGTPREICEALLQHAERVGFDQLIHEGGWVHISFTAKPRGSVLTAHFGGGGVRYTPGLA